MSSELISRHWLVLVIIDMQEKLIAKIAEKDLLIENVKKLISFARIMNIPIVLTEQYPKGLGGTIPEIKTLLLDVEPIEKVEFSCFKSAKFAETLREINARTLIISGIEAHICVMQTALDGLIRGYRPCVVYDAVSSRRLEDKEVAINRMRQCGVTIATTEMLMYEILEKAGTQEFKEALKLVK
ncbi:MAG: hydrolase [Nitrososphaerota archaeon]|nr:hydrolase [Candidatus Bathyarchaeota archaeon]MDW8048913.1 hydrolase [Nitrososphaerota archaeon]